MSRIDEIRKRLEDATPGPWRYQMEKTFEFLPRNTPGKTTFHVYKDGGAYGHPAACSNESDAALIANAPADIAYLLEEVEKLKKARRMVVQSHEYAIVAVQSAYIAGVKESPQEGMMWLHNFLCGPGLLPSDEEIEAGAQEYSDKNNPYLKEEPTDKAEKQ